GTGSECTFRAFREGGMVMAVNGMVSSSKQLIFARNSATEVGRGFEHLFELASPPGGFFGGIKLLYQLEETAFEFGHAHVLGRDIDVEQRAQFPRLVANDTAFLLEPREKGCAGERGHERYLHFV